MPTVHEQLIGQLRQFPDRLAKIVDPVSESALRQAGTNGEWGAVEILAHLRDSDDINLNRLDRILSEDTPDLESYDTDMWAIERDYHAQDPHEVLRRFRELRTKLANRLQRLDEEQWQRRAYHPRLGEVTLEVLVQQIERHDHRYLQAIKDVLL